MTDNEKRAHDLAIVVCADICRLKIQSQISNKENEVKERIAYAQPV